MKTNSVRCILTHTNFLSSFTSSINLLSAPPGLQILLPDSLYSLPLLLTCQNHLSHSGLIPTTPNISFVPLMDSFLTHHCYNPKRICTWGSPAVLFLMSLIVNQTMFLLSTLCFPSCWHITSKFFTRSILLCTPVFTSLSPSALLSLFRLDC